MSDDQTPPQSGMSVEGALAEALCRADDSMYHHERTDDFPCWACKKTAAEQATALAEWAQRDEVVEIAARGLMAAADYEEGEYDLLEDEALADLTQGTARALTAIFGSPDA